MHPLVFVAVLLAALGVTSYGVMMMPLHTGPKQVAHLGLVMIFLAVLARHFGIV